MILVSHITGNEFVRALLIGLNERGLLDSFHTTVYGGRVPGWLPEFVQNEMRRRDFPIRPEQIHTSPLREIVRLVLSKSACCPSITAHETGWASVDSVCRALDETVSKRLLRRQAPLPTAVYSYEDASLATFQAAKQLGRRRFYDLPIAYWETSQKLLREELKRWPQWAGTISGAQDSDAKLTRKTRELNLSDVVICPSKFVLDTLPQQARDFKKCIVAEFGTPEVPQSAIREGFQPDKPLRLLFAGAMTQRKGLADLFAAMNMLKRTDVELVVMGTPLAPMDFYRSEFAHFTYEAPRPHDQVLELMRTCDVLVLPSIVEGRALVQQEAMACGLPLLVTRNAGGEDLIEDDKTGFLVPIRAPEELARHISWFGDHRERTFEMGRAARQKALSLTWDSYRKKILDVISSVN